MKEFTVIPNIDESGFKLIEQIVGGSFSEFFKTILSKYGGLCIYERYYYDKKNTIWELGAFDNFTSIYGLTKEFFENYKRKLVPFAYDSGGWHFCLSFDKDTYGKIIINRWTDHTPEEQFLVIADSFEEFINGLKREDEK
jgi:SMI1-KNR4 cell-wall